MRDPDEEQAWTGPRSAGKAGTSTKSPGTAARPWSGSPQGGESAREQRRRLRRRRSGEAAYLSQVWGSQSLGVGNVGLRGVIGDEGRGGELSSARSSLPLCAFRRTWGEGQLAAPHRAPRELRCLACCTPPARSAPPAASSQPPARWRGWPRSRRSARGALPAGALATRPLSWPYQGWLHGSPVMRTVPACGWPQSRPRPGSGRATGA